MENDEVMLIENVFRKMCHHHPQGRISREDRSITGLTTAAGSFIHSGTVETPFPMSGHRETMPVAKDETTPGRNPAAPTAGDPGSSRTRRSERRERPMPIVPATPDVALPAPVALLMAAAMSNVDGCPECPNSEPPRAAVPTSSGWMCSYLCTDCGAAWTTDYEESEA
jgi:hypothetical protein